MNERKKTNRDVILPFADEVMQKCDKEGISLSNRQFEIMADSMESIIMSVIQGKIKHKEPVPIICQKCGASEIDYCQCFMINGY